MDCNNRVLAYDGTLLANMYSRKNSDRTGVYFVVYNVFLQLMRQEQFDVVVYSEVDRKELVGRAVADCGYPNIPVISEADRPSVHINAFLASFAPPPSFIADDPSVAKYMILYDVTPLALPDIEAPNQEWFHLLESSLNHEDHYFVISKYTKKDFLRFYPAIDPQKVTVSYLAASDNFYHCTNAEKINSVKQKYGIPSDAPYVFSLCTLQPRKNLVHAVKCFVDFVEQNQIDDLYFVLGGGHWEEFIQILDNEIESFGRRKAQIIKTGYVDDEDLAPLYSGAMFTVYVSLYEGFGLPVLEAMQCGCPVITSDVTSTPEVIGDAGITVDPRDPVALRRAYQRYYEDARFRNACSTRSLERAKTFSWEKCPGIIVDTIAQTWQQAVQEQRASERKRVSTKKLQRERPRLFGKDYTPQRTSVIFLGIPILSKARGPEVDTVRLLGLPLLKTYHRFYEVRTKFLGLTIRIRPNYQYIASQVELYVLSLANAMHQLGKRLSDQQGGSTCAQQPEESSSLQEAIESMKFYQLVKKVECGNMTLQDELKTVDRLLQAFQQVEE